MKYIITDARLFNKDLNPPLMVPSSSGANSVDLRACITSDLIIYPQDQELIGTGITVELPVNTIGMILPRSGLGIKGLVLGNTVGNIDPDYRGEIKVCLWNRGEVPITIFPLDRIAQFVVTPTINPSSWEMVTTLTSTERGDSGLGSTGNK